LPSIVASYALAAEAALLLPVVDLALRTMAFGRVRRLLPRMTTVAMSGERLEARADRIVAAVDAVAAEWPWSGYCLRSAIVAYVLLIRRGIPVRLIVGVDRRGRFAAHAWLECAGRIVLGAGGAQACAPLWDSGDAGPVARRP
jgi:transglutaminase superfamily protein